MTNRQCAHVPLATEAASTVNYMPQRFWRAKVGRLKPHVEVAVGFKDGFEYGALSDVGMRRTTNQDSYAVQLADSEEAWQQRGHVFIVADGMGGHAGGELASKLAVEGIPHLFHKHANISPPEALMRAIAETNSEVNRRGS